MKKQLLTLLLALPLWGIGGFVNAQSTFTEATFTAMMNRLQTDPAFFKNETDPSFTITFGNGNTSSQEDMVKFAENNIGLYKRKETSLKVSQVGSTGIATGIVVESFLSKDNPSIVRAIYKHLFTYVFSQVKGKWLWVSGQHTEFRDTKQTDEAAIKQVIEGQTQATYDRNLDKVLSFWANVPYLTMVMPSLNVNVNGDENLKKLLTDFIKGNPTPDKSTTTNDYRSIRIQGNAAYVLQNETVTSPTGTITKYVCNRYLEKQNNQWKLVSATITPANNSSFSAKTMKEILDEYKNDSKAFFNNRLSEDFRYTNQKGNYQPQKDFLGGTAQNIVSTELLQPVIFQSGDLAVVSGIHQTVRPDKDGRQTISQEAATYTFQRRNGKWMFVASQQNVVAK